MKKTAFILFIAFLFSTTAHAANQISFRTPGQAAEALVEAVKKRNSQQVIMILGNDAKDILSSGDPVADKKDRERFLELYAQESDIEMEDDGQHATLEIGEEDWPFAIPLVRDDKGWRFDMAEGRKEILYRRIGRNELAAIETTRAYVDAQDEYAELQRKRGLPSAYAQKIISSKGNKDGLYWPTSAHEKPSPLGELIAKASAEGYKIAKKPYHGYHYKILTRQGIAAEGGAANYIAQERMIGGFALIAWPAEYGDSGIMTFMVNHDGAVYQKDLGTNTARIASHVDSFNPDEGWIITP